MLVFLLTVVELDLSYVAFFFLNWLLGYCGVIMNFCRAFESEFSFFFWFLCI